MKHYVHQLTCQKLHLNDFINFKISPNMFNGSVQFYVRQTRQIRVTRSTHATSDVARTVT